MLSKGIEISLGLYASPVVSLLTKVKPYSKLICSLKYVVNLSHSLEKGKGQS